jgi:glucose-6-phosphate isomerase
MQIKFSNIPQILSKQKISDSQTPAFTKLPQNNIKKITDFAKANQHWQNILIIGIGGSSLSAQTLITALAKKNTPEFYFLDNLDSNKTSKIFSKLNWQKTLVIAIAKSGNTLETISNFLIAKKRLGKNWRQQTVIITDPDNGYLRKFANKEKLTTFEIPSEIGGRFSIFTPVGLLPAMLAKINIKKLLQGAQNANSQQALKFAKIHATEYLRGKNITTLCAYSNALEFFCKWWEQLLAESIGKSEKIGITPEIAIGATDQHSKLQLWSDGPRDKFFIFLNIEKSQTDFRIPCPPAKFNYLKNKSMHQILNLEFEATIKSLHEKDLPIAQIKIEEINEENMGELLQFWMLEIYYLSKILKVNPFDQPGVERGKVLIKKMLNVC